MKTFIEFKKQRELGEILSDTFAFLRNEFKPFFALLIKIIGPYLIAFLVSLGLYLYGLSGAFSDALASNGSQGIFTSGHGVLTIFAVIILFITGITVYTMSHAGTLFYIRSYSNNNGEVNPEEVKADVKASFWSFIALGILVGLMIGIGFVLCFIPGIYLYPPLTLTFAIMVYNRTSTGDAIGKSFELIKGEWWMTFLILIVVFIIVTIASYAFSLPAMVYQWIKMGIFSGDIDLTNPDKIFMDPVYIILNLLSYAFRFLLNFITIIATALIYFNLNEKKNFTGTFEKINSIGSNENE